MAMKIDRGANSVRYFTDWRQGRRGVGTEIRRIISVTLNVNTWAVIAVEHYRDAGAGDVLHDKDYPTYNDALAVLGDLMEAARADGYITRGDLERVPRPAPTATRPVRS